MRDVDRPLAVRGDLDARAEIHDMVIAFYREVVMDDLLGPVFEEVAEVDWSEHIPRLIDFWCRVLLGDPGYDGAILQAHQHIHDQLAFTADHFDRWYSLFTSTVEDRWAGPYADAAIGHAGRVASSLGRRVARIEWSPADLSEELIDAARGAVPVPLQIGVGPGAGRGGA